MTRYPRFGSIFEIGIRNFGFPALSVTVCCENFVYHLMILPYTQVSKQEDENFFP